MRTKKSILNFVSDIIPFFLLGILGFIKIKVFIDYLGIEVNGLVQLSTQIFAYLALAEAGFATAVIYKLYEPLANNEYKKVNAIVKGSVKIFRRIGIIMLLGGVVTAFIAPFVIQRGNISIYFISTVFLLYSVQYIVDYIFGLPYHTLLQADQKKYIANTYRNTIRILFRIFEIVLIVMGFNLIIVILLDIAFSFISNLIIINKTKKTYPWLNFEVEEDTSATEMTKDVFVHKINYLILSKTDIVILSIWGGLGLVSIYAAYDYVIKFLMDSVLRLFNSVSSGFGNLFSSNKKNHQPFNEMLSFTFFLALIIAVTYQFGINAFVRSWLGNEFELSFYISLMFSLILFNRIVIKPIDVIRDANGLFKESKKYAISQSLTNIILSIILVNYYGIAGLLFATLLSSIIINIPFNVNLVYKNVLNISQEGYYAKYLITISLFIIITYITKDIVLNFNLIPTIIYIGAFFFVFSVIVFILFNLTDNNFKSFTKRLLRGAVKWKKY